ncbi:acyltransferase family protein [Alteromonas ponticola]|uniref:Acyltransferase family protein n=1 Tax=Alteromonas ponticola TaxID=2720613 RepID=A0ABX1R1I7_9ALTE|nr:acyltransferase family protein [Alteromonas ponticola]NMH59113.1 acyltransferase family protein [Alteromonas ponticola]
MPMPDRRYYAIDHLRTCMMFVVMFGHPMLPYVTVPRSFKDVTTHIGFDIAAVFLYAFAMQAFFVTAGFAAALLFEKKGMSGLWHNRLNRILVPLLVAYVLLTPLIRGAYDFAKAVVEFDSLSAGFGVFLAGDWLRWSKLYHLWFLLSLLLFTGLTLLGLLVLRRYDFSDRLTQWVAKTLIRPSGFWLLLILFSLTTVPSYIFETGSGTHWSMQLTLLGYFMLGWFLYQRQDVITYWQTCYKAALIMALAVMPICVWSSRVRWFAEHDSDFIMGAIAGVTNGALGIAMTVALVGLFHLHMDKPTRSGKLFGQASYWVYLIHFPIVVAAGGVVAVLDAPALMKYAGTLAIAIPLITLSYYGLVLRTPLKYVIVGKTRD